VDQWWWKKTASGSWWELCRGVMAVLDLIGPESMPELHVSNLWLAIESVPVVKKQLSYGIFIQLMHLLEDEMYLSALACKGYFNIFAVYD